MMHKFLFILVSFALVMCVMGQDQLHPLCGTDGKTNFVNDPASCHGYLFCRWNETATTPTLISVHQLDCRNQGSNHYVPDPEGGDGTCEPEFPGCADSLTFFCPVNDLMIANATDPTCTQYRPCRLPGFPMMTCRAGLVFNRNTGACDLPANAPCSDPVTTPQCPIGGTGNFPGQSCWSFIFCFEGNQMGGEFECPVGWWFDPAINDCSEGDNGGQCVRPTLDFVPPRVQNKISSKQRKDITVKIEGL
ncbi:uncharacterized protein [Chironomus tepperi]|uniref:uncharacterized protein n=1 Tax=Chironomus tepperi TaxID=113505 RepID=UPI00391EEE1D